MQFKAGYLIMKELEGEKNLLLEKSLRKLLKFLML